MRYSSPKQLCFPPVAGHTLRADFEGGALSSDFGALLLRGVDRQIGLTERLTAAIRDKRHPSSIDHPLRDLLAQRMYQLASGYADANDANHLRRDPVFTTRAGATPLGGGGRLSECPHVLPSGAPEGPQRHLSSYACLGGPLHRQLC